VIASLAVSPGFRNVFAETMRPSSGLVVSGAIAARLAQPSSFGAVQSPSSERR
jgi:hypothetical protein